MVGIILRLGVIVSLPLLLFVPYLLGSVTFLPSDLDSMTLPWQGNVVGGGRVQNHYVSDALAEHYPWKVLIRDEIGQGRLPLWNPFNYLGLPLLGGSTPVVTDPLNVLLMALPLPLAFHWLVALQFVGAGLGFYWFLRSAGVGARAALFGSVAYELNGQFVVNLPFQWMLGAFLWVPVAMGAWEKATKEGRSGWYGIVALALGASALSTSLQLALVGFLAWGLYLVGRGLALRKVDGRAPLQRTIWYGAIVLVLAMAVGAIHLIPVGELIWNSWGTRHFDLAGWMADFPRRIALVGFLPVFAVPYLVWSPESLDVLKALGTAADYFNGFIGVVPAAFALVAARYARGPLATSARWLALGTLAMALLTPVGLYLYYRMLIIYILGASILAAIGLDMLLSEESGEDIRRQVFSGLFRLTTAGLVALVFVIGSIMVVFRLFAMPIQRYGEQMVRSQLVHSTSRYSSFEAFYLDRVPATWQHYAGPGIDLRVSLMVLGAFWLLLWLWEGRVNWAAPAFAGIMLLTAGDLAFYFSRYVPRVSLERYPLYPLSPSIQFLMNQPGLFRILALRDFRRDPPILPLEANIPYGLQNVHGWGSLPTLDTKRFYEAVGLRDVDRESNLPVSSRARNAADALNVRFFLTPPGTILDLEEVTLVYRGEIWIYENHRVYPRAYPVGRYEFVSSSELAHKRFKEEDTRGSRPQVFLEGAEATSPATSRPSTALPPGSVKILSYAPTRVTLETDLIQEGVVVLSDAYYPGWHAEVDGKPVPVLRANGVVRAVFVPSGKRQVVFWFDPLSVRIGISISVAACGAVLFWGSFGRLRQSRRPGAGS